MRLALSLLLATAVGLPGCSGCSKGERAPSDDSVDTTSASAPLAAPPSPDRAVAETLPRCRQGAERLAIPGSEVVVGDAVVTPDALFVGVVRRDGNKRLAGVVRASLDLANVKVIEVGPARADDPPPVPRLRGATVIVTSFARPSNGGDAGSDRGTTTRRLDVARVDPGGLVVEGSIVQQADESLAYDVAWPAGDAADKGIVAWDEDAPALPGQLVVDRGVVKVQLLASGATSRIASPDRSDAEAPRLLARPGGYWLAWLARRAEAIEDGGLENAAEAPGERRAYRWVEIVALDDQGQATSPVRRVSPEKGHIASFDLVRPSDARPSSVVVLAQDETAHAEGAGERIVRYVIERDGEQIDINDVVDGGIGHALADLLPQAAGKSEHFLAFLDVQEHAHLLPLGATLAASGPGTLEPALDGVRVVGAAPPDLFFALAPTGDGSSELRRFTCR